MLVLNTKAMREHYTIEQWLAYASNDEFIYNDQDVLNAHCEGNVLYLPWEWNVVHDCGGRVGNLFVQAPNDIYDAYMKSRNNPKIIHYAGFQKPWTDQIAISPPSIGNTHVKPRSMSVCSSAWSRRTNRKS